MDDLIAFLRARYDERERVAQAAARDAGGPDWSAGSELLSESVTLAEAGSYIVSGPYGGLNWELRRHIAANDPKSVLDDIAAKRKLVDGLADTLVNYTDDGEVPLAEWALMVLALPFAGHPEYREEWRPDTP